MSDPCVRQSPPPATPARRARPRPSGRGYRPLHFLACLCLASITASAPLVASPAARVATNAGASPSSIVFPGPSRGVPGTRTPRPADFHLHCNAGINNDAPVRVAGTTVTTGTAIGDGAGCGAMVLLLDVPGPGRFSATYGVGDADTSGQPAGVRIHVLDRDGFSLSITTVTAAHGAAVPIAVDVARAVALEIDSFGHATGYLYNVGLGGTARVLAPAAGSGSILPAGAKPVNMAGAAYGCNGFAEKPPASVAAVVVPATGAAYLQACGQFALTIPSHTRGALVLRYGMDDGAARGAMLLSLRALDAGGRLLRKAVGVAAVGGGLQPLWIDLGNVRTIQVTADNVSISEGGIDVTGVGILPRGVPPYVPQNRTISGGGPNGAVVVDPLAFAVQCNSNVGGSDVTVAHETVLRQTYLNNTACGTASLFFCCTNARGTFHALFGLYDDDTATARATVRMVVKDKDDHVLRRQTLTVTYGTPRALDVDVKLASVIYFSFSGDASALYDLRLTGIATVSQYILPPSAPPVEVPNGVAVDPHDLAVQCNMSVTSGDVRLIGATTLEGWALNPADWCGEADLNLRTSRYPRHAFYARVGIKLGEAPTTNVTVTLNALNAAGKVIRSAAINARYGYGTQPVHLSLAGAATVRIKASAGGSIVYALTAA